MDLPGNHHADRAGSLETGEELQRRVPKPARRVPRWFHPDEPVSQRRELVEGTFEAVGTVGPLGAALAISAAVLNWVRDRRG